MSFLRIALVFLLGALTGLPAQAACRCAQPPAPLVSLQEAKAVFTGQVIALKSTNTYRKIVFRLDKAWKGVSRSQVVVYTGVDACDVEFLLNERYLVYASDAATLGLEAFPVAPKALRIGFCGRTAKLEDAGEDLAALPKK